VGYLDGAGDGEWFIGLRSAVLRHDGSRVCAGAGIVAGSDPAAELAETTIKLRPVLQALYPGAEALLNDAR
jgi:menaquinone-specific isochorismate synthase